MNPSDEEISHVLRNFRRIAVVGLSPREHRPSHSVTRYLISRGYEITGVRPGSQEILGRPVVSNLAEVEGPLEIVDVFRAPEQVPPVVDEAIAAGARVIWLQEGITHPEAEERARQAGLTVISDRCMLKEHMRLRIPSKNEQANQ